MSTNQRLPNFLLIGAAKSGTTALQYYLAQHPQIFMCPVKETNFFALDGTPPRFGGPRAEIINKDSIWRVADYRRLFEGVTQERAVGEVCPRYLFTPGTAARIARRMPDVRILAVLRHPADRAFSSFLMYKRDGFEPSATLAEAIEDEPRRIRENWAYAIHASYGFYAGQLQEYYEFFPKSQILCLLYEDMVLDPQTFYTRIFEFLEVDPSFRPDASQHYNRSGIIRNPVLRLLWTRTHPIRQAAPLLPKPVRRRIAGFFTSRPMDRPPFPQETRHRLMEIYREDIHWLQVVIGRNLGHWLEAVPSNGQLQPGQADCDVVERRRFVVAAR